MSRRPCCFLRLDTLDQIGVSRNTRSLLKWMLDFVDFTKPMEFLKTLWDRSREFEINPPRKRDDYHCRVSFLWSSIHLPSHGALCHAESRQHGLCRAETGRNPTVRCLWSMVPKTAVFSRHYWGGFFSGWPLMIWWPLLRPANPAMQAFNMQFYLIWASGGNHLEKNDADIADHFQTHCCDVCFFWHF